MPYNTRRKSLSLSELGIVVPKRHRASTTAGSKDASDEPVCKKPRCSPSPLSSPPLTANVDDNDNVNVDVSIDASDSITVRPSTERPQPAEKHVQQSQPHSQHTLLATPPSSPRAAGSVKVDVEGISDSLVVAVIKQLEQTANRPMCTRELASVLANTVPAVAASTNPAALIQARLANYICKGNWPIISPCPLGKEQETVHPRRVFYYLTTMTRQPIPESCTIANTMRNARRRVVSPALSSAASDDLEQEHDIIRTRFHLSPSPEVDLSSPDLDDVDVNGACESFDKRTSLSRDSSSASLYDLQHNRRAASPPLDRVEVSFKQTASELQEQRRSSQELSRKSSMAMTLDTPSVVKSEPRDETDTVVMSIEGGDDDVRGIGSSIGSGVKDVASLFESHANMPTPYGLSSPLMRPQQVSAQSFGATPRTVKAVSSTIDTVMADFSTNRDLDSLPAWGALDDLKSPEAVDLDELEVLFNTC